MKHLLTFAAFAVVAVCAAPAFTEQWPELDDVPAVERSGEGDVAIVVAVEDYAFLPDVPGATKNAAAWERFLRDGLGVPTVLMLTNQQAVREEILAFAARGAKNVKPDGTLWFVFIGHGAPDTSGKDGLLIGADGQQNVKSMSARGVPQTKLLETLESGQQSNTVVVLDACFSGRDASGGALAKGTMPVLPVSAAPKTAATTAVLSAAKADEFAGALPGANRPAFSYLILGAIRGWAAGDDEVVTAEEAVTFARREMLQISGRQQTPQLAGTSAVVLSKGVSEPRPRPSDLRKRRDPDPMVATGEEEIRITTNPPGAKVFIDDVGNGKAADTPTALAMKPGDYKVIVRKEGYRERVELVSLRTRQTLQLELELVPVDASSSTADVDYTAEATDGIPDSPFYASATIGPGIIDNFGDVGIVGDFGIGAKLNGFSPGPNEWRVGLRLGLSSHKNGDAPSEGSPVGGGQVFADDTVQDTAVFTWVVGPEVGRGWRSESGGGLFGDSVFVLSAFGVYGSQPSVCETWALDTSSGSREITCQSTSSVSGPGAGLSAGASIGLLRFSAQFAYLLDVDVFGSVTAGLTFDI